MVSVSPLDVSKLSVGSPGGSVRSPSPTASPAASPREPMHNVAVTWITTRLCSRDRVERHYSFLIAVLIAATALFALIKTEGPMFKWGAPVCSMWAIALASVTLTNVYAEQREKSGLFELTRLIQFVLAMLSVLIYYDGSNVVNRWRFAQRGDAMLYDEQLLKMDEFLLGWLYPKGQMALYLDTQPTYGVTTQIGRVYAEMLQILYISYYFWGNAIGVWLAYQYFWYSVYKKNKGTKKRMQWRRIQMFVSAWVSAFVLNHLVNLCFPAMSPRIFIKDCFQNELRGLWLLGGLRNAVTNAAANTYSAFPSGHCGLSMLAVILSFRIGLAKSYSYLVLTTTILIVLATQVLRYHYFVDFLFSWPLVAFGTWLGGFHDVELYQRSLTEMDLEDHDEDGKPMTSPTGPYPGESVPLMSMGGGLPSSASRTKLSSISPGGSGLDEPDLESGRSGPPVLSSQAFGSMPRSMSHNHMNTPLGKIEETESSKGV